jgi:hypothetical protein
MPGGTTGPVYGAADVDITLNSAAPHSAIVTFSNNTQSTGDAFAVGTSRFVYFTVEHKVTVSPIGGAPFPTMFQ